MTRTRHYCISIKVEKTIEGGQSKLTPVIVVSWKQPKDSILFMRPQSWGNTLPEIPYEDIVHDVISAGFIYRDAYGVERFTDKFIKAYF